MDTSTKKLVELAESLVEATAWMELASGECAQGADEAELRDSETAVFTLLWADGEHYEVSITRKK